MNTSAVQPEDSADANHKHDNRPIRRSSSDASVKRGTNSPSRPQLLRLPPTRLTNIVLSGDDDGDYDPSTVDSDGSTEDESPRTSKPIRQRHQAAARPPPTAEEGTSSAKPRVSSPEEEQIAKLREAVTAKLLRQQRSRSGNDLIPARQSAVVPQTSQRPQIPSFNPSTASVDTVDSASTESTESARTIRGSVPVTPAAASNVTVRTPSYPFPRVTSSNPKSWASIFHQPFTTLSPTTPSQPLHEHSSPNKSFYYTATSGGSTPLATHLSFLPQTSAQQEAEDERFPTPNLYDLVLQVNSEPGLDAWWSTVTRIMHQYYKAERATLSMPADPTDIENVPWGQKATFNMNGQEVFVSHRTVVEQTMRGTRPPHQHMHPETPSSDVLGEIGPQKLHRERLRPTLGTRHSYAGHSRPTKELLGDVQPDVKSRPKGPQRTVTHAPGIPGGVGPERLRSAQNPNYTRKRHTSMTDPDFSSVAGGGIDAGPNIELFPTLRALDHEIQPLIETVGVHRVLDRGRVVTVTRDYAAESSDSTHSQSSGTPSVATAFPHATETSKATRLFGSYRHMLASENNPEPRREYEEYEQAPSSPWAQSPAPSPAIQQDEEENPFFTSEEQQVEDSFNPVNTPKDYSQYTQVEAIGIDRASTVTHIPLVHPTLSQPMQSLRMKPGGEDETPSLKRSNTVDVERRLPLTILSILTSIVPYPSNLMASLHLLGPHLATSFALAQQFSYTTLQAQSAMHRRSNAFHVDNGSLNVPPASLDDIVKADLDDFPTSLTGSITSPSDYSGRSRHSPTGSFAGTPGWDTAAHASWTTGNRSHVGTPAPTSNDADSYFDTKRQAGQRAASQSISSARATPLKPAKRPLVAEPKSRAKNDDNTPRSEPRPQTDASPKEDRSQVHATIDTHSPADQLLTPHKSTQDAKASDGGDRRHSLLHSYGADYQASFASLSAMTPGEAKTPGLAHSRKTSVSEDMPPPSERLLRTIIDSLPVQIFTAAPDTGMLTWVNSKFLIYRGKDSRQVISEPWQAIHPEDRVDYMEAWTRCLQTGQQLQQKVRLQRFDGNYRWFYVRAAPLKDKRQHTVHWIGTNMDFHEQHLAEVNLARQQETAASEAKYRALANSSPQIVFAANKAKGVIFCNSQWMSYSGQTEMQALGMGFMDHVHPADLAKCRLPTFDDGSSTPTNVPTSVPSDPQRTEFSSGDSSSGSSDADKGSGSSDISNSPISSMPQRKLSELASVGILKGSRDADGRPSYSTEVRLRTKDGEFRWHLVRVLLAEPMLQTSHEEETWYGTCTDINDHKTLERDLKETMDEKSRFLSNMSHEIRTPLNGITGMVNFLIDSNLTAEQMEHVNIIRASTEGLRGLINDILDLSKAEAGMIQLNMDWMYVRDLIEEVNDLTSAMAIDKGLELNYLVQENVPPQIKGDRFRIRQILLNVVGNAIKFTQSGEVFVRCTVAKNDKQVLSKGEILIQFDVVDTGQGFTDKEAEALFKRFSQIDGSSTRQHGGSGLGLVISRQLAHLHGGDMSAKGLPGKGSTFTFFIQASLPTRDDQPRSPPAVPPIASIPILPISPSLRPTTIPTPPLPKASSVQPSSEAPIKMHPRLAAEMTASPSPYASPDIGKESPGVSSASSDPSIRSATRTASLRSERSSASSVVPEANILPSPPMELAMPSPTKRGSDRSSGEKSTPSTDSTDSSKTPRAKSSPSEPVLKVFNQNSPPIYSIIVVAPLRYSREATVEHIDKTLPKHVPHQVTARESLAECRELLGGEEPVVFSHVVAVLQDSNEIIALIRQITSSAVHTSTTMVIITDLAQRRKIIQQAPDIDYKALETAGRLLFVFKPLKPSRFGAIFDPRKEREMSTDRFQNSAQQVLVTQKQVFEELTRRLGNRDKRVLLVEDNKVNQVVILKFFSKVAIEVETVMDGVQCTDKVFAHPPGHYSIILCDLHMPNKDGYQTCKEIRKWEKNNKFEHLPIIALSANVLGDVYQKCVDAGFNSYITKPVDFKELSTVLMTFMDPTDPSKPHEFMKKKGKKSAGPGARDQR